MSVTVQLSNRELANKHAHLTNLAAASLPDTQSENLVAWCVAALEVAIKARQKRMRALEERRQRYAALSEDERADKLSEWLKLQDEIEAVWLEEVSVTVPEVKLTDENFPRALKKSAGAGQNADGSTFVLDGAANARGNAAAKAALAPEYYTLSAAPKSDKEDEQ